MTNIVVRYRGGDHEIEDVETWWYEGIDLHIRFPNQKTATYPGGNVMERF